MSLPPHMGGGSIQGGGWTPNSSGGYLMPGEQGQTIIPPGALEAAQAAYAATYQAEYLATQDRWHAEEMAERAAMRKLQESIALGYINGQPTLERQLGEGNLGLGYLQMLASLRGPSDWIRYWNTTRAAQQTSLPSWAAALQSNLKLPAFQAPTVQPVVAAGQWSQAAGQPPTVPPTGGSGTGQNASAGVPAANAPYAHQINAQVWANMLPSEREGLRGLVEAQGGWWPDYERQMYAAFPTGRAGSRTMWG